MDPLEKATVDLACELIRRPSVSPKDEGCQQVMADLLEARGFHVEWLPFGDVTNFWATRGESGPILAFAGHTDVVPTGPLDAWRSPPFEPTITGTLLTGRGAADMKGSLAAMLTAIDEFDRTGKAQAGTLALLITSDEEADAINGTRKVIEELEARGTKIDYCVVGEPSSTATLGDVIRVGRRGSLSATLTVNGIQGHVAYPDDADNPIHTALPALAQLAGETWDTGNERFPPTSMQISNIHAGTGANNVIPGKLEVMFNFRFSTESTADTLKARTHAILDAHGLDYHIDWWLSGNPFLTTGTTLISHALDAIREVSGAQAVQSTSGGTSDGRFISPTGAELIELGPCNATIHKIDECVDTRELAGLARIYAGIIGRLLASH